jgi:hypothetical protein
MPHYTSKQHYTSMPHYTSITDLQWELFIDNLFGRAMALGTTQPLTEKSAKTISGGGGVKAAGAQDW